MPENQVIEPVSPEVIDADPLVIHSFQACGGFKKIHSSSVKAERSYQVAPECVGAAYRISEAAGLPPVERIVASSPKSRLMIFSMEAKNASPPGPRVFGLTTKPEAKLEEAVKLVKPLL